MRIRNTRRRAHRAVAGVVCTGVVAATLVAAPGVAQAETVTVNTIPELVAAVAAAEPGDRVLLADGTYTDIGAIALTNTAANPEHEDITIAAANRGKAVFTGDTRITLRDSSYLVFRDFFFDSAVTSAPGTVAASGNVLTLDRTSFSKVTNNYFYHSGNSGSPFARVLYIFNTSTDNQVAHNTFEDPVGTPITVRDNKQADVTADEQNDNNWIHHNVFKNGKYTLDAYPQLRDANGMEAIQLGVGGGTGTELFARVENNLFQNYTGDAAEIVSNKSSQNVIRYNTFRNNQSGLTLRGGDDIVVDGNFFLGMGAGMRVFGRRHIIRNNYFTGGQIGIVMPTGTLPGYVVGEDVTIVNNTFVNNAVNELYIGAPNTPNDQPTNTLVANNLVVTNRGTAFRTAGSVGTTFSNNIAYLTGSAQPGTIDPGIVTADPNLTPDGELSRPSADSVIIDRGQHLDDVGLPFDMDGQSRTGRPDVGADEVSTRPIGRGPITLATTDVGVDWAVGDAWVISSDRSTPSAPTNVRVTSATATSVTVAWDPATDDTGVAGYEVFTGDNSLSSRDSLGTTTGASFTITGLTPGVGIRVAVKASDAARNVSFPSTTILAMPAPPPTVTVAAPAKFAPGRSEQVVTTLDNASEPVLSTVDMRLVLPAGWTAEATSPSTFTDVAQGEAVTTTWSVTPGGPGAGLTDIKAQASYTTPERSTTAERSLRVWLEPPNQIPAGQLTATASDVASGHVAIHAIDGRLDTFWHSQYQPVIAPFPHTLTLALASASDVTALYYQPRLDGPNGVITSYKVYASTDGSTYTEVAAGNWAPDATTKSVSLSAPGARFIRLEALAGQNGYASAGEVVLVGVPGTHG